MIVPLSAEPFPNRLRRKIMSLVPLVVVGVVVSVVLLVLISLLAPYLPPAYHHLLAQLQQGDWANSRASLVRIFESYIRRRPGQWLITEPIWTGA